MICLSIQMLNLRMDMIAFIDDIVFLCLVANQ